MKAIMLLLAAFAVYVYFNGMPGNDAGAFDAAGNPIVEVYTTPGCGSVCNDALKKLKTRGVEFTHHHVDQQNKQTEAYEAWSKYRINGFPLIVAGYDKLLGVTPARLAAFLGKNFGDEYLMPIERRYYSKHFYDDGSPKIVLYGTDWCPGCAQLKKDFAAINADYLEIDVEKPSLQTTMLQVMEIGGYPATWVGYTRINSVDASKIVKAQELYSENNR